VTKDVNSAFLGRPDLDGWLRARRRPHRGLRHHDQPLLRDDGAHGRQPGLRGRLRPRRTHSFDRTGPDGTTYDADTLASVTAANLHDEVATIVTTAEVVARATAGAT